MADFIQNGGSNGGTYASHFSGILSVWEISCDATNNTSNIGYRLQLKSGSSGRFSDLTASYSVTIDGTTVKSGNGRYTSQNYNTTQTICEGTTTVVHNSDGSKTIGCSAVLDFQSHTYSPGDFTLSGDLTLTTINKSLNINSFTLQSRGLNSLIFNWSTNKICNSLYFDYFDFSDNLIYSSANQINEQCSSGSFTVTGLQPNTTYKVRIRPVSTDGTSAISSKISTTTLDISKISSISNFEHGSNVRVVITNPANINNLNLIMKIGDTAILNRNVNEGNNTIIFNDTELDNLYKKYGTNNNLNVTFSLTGSGYTNTKTCIVTLNGNHKTISLNKNGNWKRGNVWINVEGIWRRGIIWNKVDGTWRRCI